MIIPLQSSNVESKGNNNKKNFPNLGTKNFQILLYPNKTKQIIQKKKKNPP